MLARTALQSFALACYSAVAGSRIRYVNHGLVHDDPYASQCYWFAEEKSTADFDWYTNAEARLALPEAAHGLLNTTCPYYSGERGWGIANDANATLLRACSYRSDLDKLSCCLPIWAVFADGTHLISC